MEFGMTPNLRRVRARLSALFPDLGYGVYNCRHIGSDPKRPWSQHAASNAVDLWSPHYPRIRLNPFHMRYMDRVVAYLDTNRAALGINHMLWRTAGHWDHAHVDFWPKMEDRPSYEPPCRGGALVVVYPDGHRDNKFALYPEEDSEVLSSGDKGLAVKRLQRRLNRWATTQPGLDPLETDGVFGPATASRVVAYQEAIGVEGTGVVGGITWAELKSYDVTHVRLRAHLAAAKEEVVP